MQGSLGSVLNGDGADPIGQGPHWPGFGRNKGVRLKASRSGFESEGQGVELVGSGRGLAVRALKLAPHSCIQRQRLALLLDRQRWLARPEFAVSARRKAGKPARQQPTPRQRWARLRVGCSLNVVSRRLPCTTFWEGKNVLASIGVKRGPGEPKRSVQPRAPVR